MQLTSLGGHGALTAAWAGGSTEVPPNVNLRDESSLLARGEAPWPPSQGARPKAIVPGRASHAYLLRPVRAPHSNARPVRTGARHGFSYSDRGSL